MVVNGPHGDDLRSIALQHPKYFTICRYLTSGSRIFELSYPNQEQSSWFINDYVESNGRLVVATPVDPLFFLLPHLKDMTIASNGCFVPFDQAFSFSPALKQLQSCAIPDQLENICEIKRIAGETYLRHSQTQTHLWLRAKVDRLCQQICLHPSFSLSSESSFNSPHIIASALGLVSEYISADLLETLVKSYNLSVDDISLKKKNSGQFFTETQVSADGIATRVSASKRKAEPAAKVSNKVAKVDTKGMRSISAFFGSAGGKKN
jgi:ribonuclease H2 subunit B